VARSAGLAVGAAIAAAASRDAVRRRSRIRRRIRSIARAAQIFRSRPGQLPTGWFVMPVRRLPVIAATNVS
jgi:RNase P protein component